MRVKHLICISLFISLAFGCDKSNKNKLIGTWIVDIDDHIMQKNNWYNLLDNMLIFRRDQTCSGISFYNPQTKTEISGNGKWRCFSNNNIDYIILDIPNNSMNGKYEITFYKDRKLLRMKMKNDHIEFTASKFSLDFNNAEY